MSLLLLLFFGLKTNGQVYNVTKATTHSDLQAAINAASDDDLLELTQDLNIGTNKITINKRLTIDGKGFTITENKTWSSNNDHSFSFSKAGSTLKNVKIKKTNYESTTASAQKIIAAFANNLTFDGITIEGVKGGLFNLFTTTSYGFETTYSVKDLIIKNSHFQTLGILGYVNPNSTGEITNNTYNTTSGWNLHKNTQFQLVGNVWSGSANFVNVLRDSPTDTDWQSNWYSCKIPMIEANNTNVTGKIRDNEVPRQDCGPVWNKTQDKFYQTIHEAMAEVNDNDELELLGNVNEPSDQTIVNKTVSVNGNGHTVNLVPPTNMGGGYGNFLVSAPNVSFTNMVINRDGNNSWSAVFTVISGGNNFGIDSVVLNALNGPFPASLLGVELSYNLSGFSITNSEFNNFTLAGYVNGNTTGEIKNNTINNSPAEGFAVAANTQIDFTGNQWNNNGDHDIFIFDDGGTISAVDNWYTCPVMMQIYVDNNLPVMENQLLDINSCVCRLPGNFTGNGVATEVGISSLDRGANNQDGWPQIHKGAWLTMESQTKGFVPNRLNNDQVAAIAQSDLVVGMMVYNTDRECLQVYTGTTNGWKCFNVPACPDYGDCFNQFAKELTTTGASHQDLNYSVNYRPVNGYADLTTSHIIEVKPGDSVIGSAFLNGNPVRAGIWMDMTGAEDWFELAVINVPLSGAVSLPAQTAGNVPNGDYRLRLVFEPDINATVTPDLPQNDECKEVLDFTLRFNNN